MFLRVVMTLHDNVLSLHNGASCNDEFVFIIGISSSGCRFFVIGSERAELDISKIHPITNSTRRILQRSSV